MQWFWWKSTWNRGLTLALSIFPVLKKGKSSYGRTIYIRWIRSASSFSHELMIDQIALNRTAPAILCLVAVELLFPIAGNGPMYSEIADRVAHQCSNNWALNVLFIMNWNWILENCATHTFWSSVEFQLFLIGLLAFYLYIKNKKLGIAFCITMGLLDFIVTGYISIKYQTVHALAAHPMDAKWVGIVTDTCNIFVYRKVEHYVDYIHQPTTNYLFTYMVGLLLGLFMENGGRVNVGTVSRLPFQQN